MRMAEEFERCSKCNGGWFRVETLALVMKGSPQDNPLHYQEKTRYKCETCGHEQYVKKK